MRWRRVRTSARMALGVLAGLLVFVALTSACWWPWVIVKRECFRVAELIGIMDPKGDLGGQVAGFNYQRHPRWVHWASDGVAALGAYGGPAALGLLVMHRVGRGPLRLRATVCGKCGGEFRAIGVEASGQLACACCGGER